MLKKWGPRALIGLGALLGLFLVFAFALSVPAVGQTIGSPKACNTCHVMQSEVKSLSVDVHRDLACTDCHSARGFVEKPVDELKTASRHLFIFVSNTTPDVIKPAHGTRELIQENCVACHALLVSNVHASMVQSGRLCFDCHREVPHGTPRRND
jgi:cytochrome c nitrite reductase small subunit